MEGLKSTALDHKDTAKEFFRAILLSKRFRNAVVTDFEDCYSSDDDVQFAAVTLKLDDGSLVVAFRGTDDSLAGWREDFMITFTRPKAQQLAYEYLKRNLRWNKKVYVCGHSKGGNLALYAVSALDDNELGRIKALYINDGPGLCEEVVEKGRMKRLDGITTVIMPEDSVFGRIFEPDFTNKIIVKSINSGVMAHSIYSWRIDNNSLVTAKNFSKGSDFVNGSLNKILESEDLESRKELVNKFFDILKANGYERISDFKENGFKELLILIPKLLDAAGIRPKEILQNRMDNLIARISEERS